MLDDDRAHVDGARSLEVGGTLSRRAGCCLTCVLGAAGLVHAAEQHGRVPVLLVAGPLRLPLQRLLRGTLPQLPVISFSETTGLHRIETIGQVGRGHEFAARG